MTGKGYLGGKWDVLVLVPTMKNNSYEFPVHCWNNIRIVETLAYSVFRLSQLYLLGQPTQFHPNPTRLREG